ncbi:MAG: Ig-like domain-containing protein, partial [Thermoplasmata archaeon]|nr:Ig-like domain-containing protein [Thermoplasmata archaeon]
SSTVYTFQITGGKDLAGNDLVAGGVPNPWTFTTSVCPYLTATTPIDRASAVSPDSDVVITFSEEMSIGSVTWSCSDITLGWSSNWNSPTNTILTLQHTTNFEDNTTYTFEVTGGEDMEGNPLVPGPLSNPWTFTTTLSCSISLHGGWNLISLPLIQTNTSILAVLSSIDGEWDYVQYYNTTDANDHWKTYATFKPSSLNDLWNLNHTMGFWLHTMEACTLNVTGSAPTSTSIPLYAGWNLVGYPSLTEKNISDALAGTDYDRVEGFNATAPYRLGQLADSYIMQSGEGYWVHVPSNTVWTIDW